MTLLGIEGSVGLSVKIAMWLCIVNMSDIVVGATCATVRSTFSQIRQAAAGEGLASVRVIIPEETQ